MTNPYEYWGLQPVFTVQDEMLTGRKGPGNSNQRTAWKM